MTTQYESPSLPSSPTLQPFYPNLTLINTATTKPSPNQKRVHSSPQLINGSNNELSLHSNNNNFGGKKLNKGKTLLEEERDNINNNLIKEVQQNATISTSLNLQNDENVAISLPTSQASVLSSSSSRTTSTTTRTEGQIIGVGRQEIPIVVSSVLSEIAESQTRRLYDMPIEFSTALSRLCSQHRSSQYNTMKRATTDSNINVAPVTFLSNQPVPSTIPTRPYMATRSHSTPNPTPSSQSPSIQHPREPTSVPLSANVSNTSASTTSSNVSPPLLTTQTFLPSVSTSTSSATTRQSSPVESTPSTPPPGLSPDLIQTSTLLAVSSSSSTTISTIENSSTSLTPTLTNFNLNVNSNSNTGRDLTERVPIPAGLKVHLLPGMRIMNGVAVKTSASHPMNITAIIPPEFIPLLSSHILRPRPSTHNTRSTLSESSNDLIGTPFIITSPSLSFDLWDVASQPTSFTPLIESLALASASSSSSSNFIPPFGIPSSSSSSTRANGKRPELGNFYLSSCPGKKVRLDGIIQGRGGRGAICRSVEMDLERAKLCGVKVVICCLDDAELEYLGSPWSEYLAAANSLSLKIIRIPMVEGFAPLSPSSLDTSLAKLIQDHTLKGESILAHCRGGIGRAGLIACVWMIKMGLICVEGVEEGEEREGGLEEEMRVVERVIEVIRRRRSVKSIETPQQVHFLLDYVTYLKQKSQVVQAFEL